MSTNKNSSSRKAIGIDLGTTYSCVGIFENGTTTIIANEQGNRITPSYVAFTEEGERLIGDAAKNQANMNHKRTIFDVKRLIGRRYNEESVQNDIKHFSFNVIDDNGKPKIRIETNEDTKVFTPEEISAMVLQKMKKIAEDYLGHEVKEAVITVPAYFNDSQRQATKDAGTIAGLNVLRIINEPTAAALAYGFQDKSKKEKNILIYDLGGGTFDVSVVMTDGEVFEVKSTHGNTHLGGSDFDQLLTDYLLEEFVSKNKSSFSKNEVLQDDKVKRRIRTQAERAKRTLSSTTRADIEIDSLYKGIDFQTTITRAKFESLCEHLFRSTLKNVDSALSDAKLSKSEIDEVVLVGGSTRIPKVQEILSNYFNGKELCKSINPDEAVAFGAAVQAAILTGTATGSANSMVLLDVNPLSLGIETRGQFMTNIIDRNTAIPCKKTQTFTTFQNNQPAVTIAVYEGERKFTKDNNLLGKFNLEGIPPAPAGVPKIEVTFELDANSILKVTAKDLGTGKSNNITITNDSGRLSKNDIEKMVNDAKKFEEQDNKSYQNAIARNNLESTINSTKTFLTENTDKLKDYDSKEIDKLNEFIKDTEEWLNKSSTYEKSDYDQKMNEHNKLFHPISQHLYKDSNQNSGAFNENKMPNLSPEQMKEFEEMMKDPVKRAQMEEIAKSMDPMGMGGPSGGSGMSNSNSKGSSPSISEVD